MMGTIQRHTPEEIGPQVRKHPRNLTLLTI